LQFCPSVISPCINFAEETVVVSEAPRFPKSSSLSREEAIEVWLKRENMIFMNSVLAEFFDQRKFVDKKQGKS